MRCALLAAALLVVSNQARVAHHLRPLHSDARIAVAAADASSERLLPRLSEAGYPARRAGENIAWGQHSAREVVLDWLRDPPHAENLLDPRARVTGVSVRWSPIGIVYRQVYASR